MECLFLQSSDLQDKLVEELNGQFDEEVDALEDEFKKPDFSAVKKEISALESKGIEALSILQKSGLPEKRGVELQKELNAALLAMVKVVDKTVFSSQKLPEEFSVASPQSTTAFMLKRTAGAPVKKLTPIPENKTPEPFQESRQSPAASPKFIASGSEPALPPASFSADPPKLSSVAVPKPISPIRRLGS